jgi:hypothetical protein
VASAAAFLLHSSGDSSMNTDIPRAVSWKLIRSQCGWLEQQGAHGHIECSVIILLGESPRQTTSSFDGPCRTWFLGKKKFPSYYLSAPRPPLHQINGAHSTVCTCFGFIYLSTQPRPRSRAKT